MSAVAKHRKKLVWIALAGVAFTLAAAGLNWRPIAARFVTQMALRDAERLIGVAPLNGGFDEKIVKSFVEKYGGCFRHGLLDREYVAQHFIETIVTPDCLAPWLVLLANYLANQETYKAKGQEFVFQEFEAWLNPVLLRSASREALVNLLTSDYRFIARTTDQSAGLAKEILLNILFSVEDHSGDKEWLEWEHFALGAMKDTHWQVIAKDCDHPREKVRAGAILLLYRHPSQELFLEKAHRALQDSSEWVRLAASGALALRRDSSGAEQLLSGLSHERWEIRYWCALGLKTLKELKSPRYLLALRRSAQLEKDIWLKKQLAGFVEGFELVFPGKEWVQCSPEDAKLDVAALQAFQAHVGGRGCVVRDGNMAYTWGDLSQRGDIASAAKTIYTHFLFKVIEDRRFFAADGLVHRFEPGLESLNPALGNKDAKITWRHLANQISCYGVTEVPGTAFDYSDFNIAFFFDTLFLNVYGVKQQDVDNKVLHAKLTDIIECQDNPTFFTFGFDDRPGRVGISVRDFARFGLLYLRKGEWAGKRLMEEGNVTLATTSPLPNSIRRTEGKPAEMLHKQRSIGGGNNQTDHLGSYSFAWWTNGVDRDGKRHWPDAPVDAYGAFGHGGMRALVIIPSLDILACWNDSPNEGREKESEALRLLAKSVVKP